MQLEAITELVDGLFAALEAPLFGIRAHHFHQQEDVFAMFSHREERRLHQRLVFRKFFSMDAPENINVFLRQFEGRHFKPNRARGVGQHKAKINV